MTLMMGTTSPMTPKPRSTRRWTDYNIVNVELRRVKSSFVADECTLLSTRSARTTMYCSICHKSTENCLGNFLQGIGCRSCQGTGIVTNEKIDSALADRPIRRLEQARGSIIKINWQCNRCNHIWNAAPNDILNNLTGCPVCVHVVSMEERAWLRSLGITNTQMSIKINDTLIKVDGWDPTTNTIYEFYGDFFHGNPQKYDHYKINAKTKTTFGSLYAATMRKRQLIIDSGFHLVEMWESQWRISNKYNYRKMKKLHHLHLHHHQPEITCSNNN